LKESYVKTDLPPYRSLPTTLAIGTPYLLGFTRRKHNKNAKEYRYCLLFLAFNP